MNTTHDTLRTTQTMMKLTYGIVPIVAGLDKFTNVLADWQSYIHPSIASSLPISGNVFMMIVGVIEIVAGILVLSKTKLGAAIVSAWLALIGLTLLTSGKFLDVAVRDIVMAIGALALVKLTSALESDSNTAALPSQKLNISRAGAVAVITTTIIAFTLGTSPVRAHVFCDTRGSEPKTSSAYDLHRDMRKLWQDHIVWTRNVILCIVDNLPGTNEAVTRLLKNQDDIGNAIKPVYGEDAGKKLTELLHEHITVAADLLKAAKSGNNSGFEQANKKWYENADEIAGFLSKANPNWEFSEMKMMMHDHLKLTTEEAVARMKKDYAADVVAYEKVTDEILKMSDMLASGIIKQFPTMFSK